MKAKISDDRLSALLNEGCSQTEIARRFGCTKQAVNFRIHCGTKPNEHLRWAKHARVYWFFIQGLSAEEIAKRIDSTESTVSMFKRKFFPHLNLRPGRRSAIAGAR